MTAATKVRTLNVGDLRLPTDAVTQTFVIFGKRGSGKSNTGVVLAEEMHRVGAPIIVLDPVSAWWGLKASVDGEGPGLPVYIFGGPRQDLPLQPAAGELMARVAIEHRIPMVLDMKGWTGGERARFVTAFAEYLLDHNDRTPVHVFLEEADAFIPQRPYKGEERMLGAMDRLIRWGRQEGIGATVITQRSAKINKDVTTQAETLIAHRTTGPQDRDAIDNWIKFHAGGEQRQEILSTLAGLPDGTAWVWSPEWLDILRQVTFRRRQTFDSAATPKLGERRVEPKALAQVDVDRLTEQLAATVEQAKADDPRELRRRIVELERQAARERQKPSVTPTVEIQRIEVPVLNGQVDELRDVLKGLQEFGQWMSLGADRIVQAAGSITAAIGRVTDTPMRGQVERAPRGVPGPGREAPRTGSGRGDPAVATLAPAAPSRTPAPMSSEAGEGRALKAGARRMLSALAWLHPTPLTRNQLATLSDISPTSGTFSDYLSAIRGAGLIEEAGRLLQLSDAGQTYVADELGRGAPTSDELLEMWGRKLKLGARRMLQALHDVHPGGLTRAELGERAEISTTSGTFSDYLSALRRNGLLDESGGLLRAGEALFLGGRR